MEPSGNFIEAGYDKVGGGAGEDVGSCDRAVIDIHLEATL